MRKLFLSVAVILPYLLICQSVQPRLVLPGQADYSRSCNLFAATADERYLVYAADNQASIFEFFTGRKLYTLDSIIDFEGRRPYYGYFHFASNSRYYLTSGARGTAVIGWVKSGEVRTHFDDSTHGIINAIFSNSSEVVATGSSDGRINIWNSESGKLNHLIQCGIGRITDMEFSLDDRLLAIGSADGNSYVVDVASGNLLHILKCGLFPVHQVGFNRTGDLLVVGTATQVLLYDVTDGSLRSSLFQGEQSRTNNSGLLFNTEYELQDFSVAEFDYSGENVLCVAKTSAMLYYINIASGEIRWSVLLSDDYFGEYFTYRELHAHFSPDGRKVIAGTGDDEFRPTLHDANSGKVLEAFSNADNFNIAGFSHSGKYILLAGRGRQNARVYSAIDYRLICDLSGIDMSVQRVTASSIDSRVMVSSNYSQTYLWDIDDLRPTSISVEDENCDNTLTYVVRHRGYNLELFNLRTQEVMCILDTAELDEDGIPDWSGEYLNTKVSWSQNSKYLCLYTSQGKIEVWDVNSLRSIASFRAKSLTIESAEIDNSGNNLLLVTYKSDATRSGRYESEIGTREDRTYEVGIYGVKKFKRRMKLGQSSNNEINAKFSPLSNSVILSYNRFYTNDPVFSEVYFIDSSYQFVSRDLTIANSVHCHMSQDQIWIVSINSDSNICRVYNVSTRQLILEEDSCVDAKFSPDSRELLLKKTDRKLSHYTFKKSGWNFQRDFYPEIGSDIAFEWMYDSHHFIYTTEAGQIQEWSLDSSRWLNTFIVSEEGFFLINNAGYYSGDQEILNDLYYLTSDMNIITFDQLDARYNRPDLVMQSIGCVDTARRESYYRAYQKRIVKLGIDTGSFTGGMNIPIAYFEPPSGFEQGRDKLEMRVHASDSIRKLDRLHVWVNDCPIWGQSGISLIGTSKYTVDTIIEIPLCSGVNKIEVSTMNTAGIESYRSPIYVNYTPEKPTTPKTYFVGIGVDRFADPQYNLNWSTKDIRDQCAAMQQLYGENFVIVDTLFNQNVTVENVQAIKAKLMQTNVNDRVIVAYSGHGLLSENYDYYLSTYDVNFHKPEEKGLAYEELENLVDSIPARQKLMLIDACHSGEVDKEEMLRLKKANADTSLHLVSNGKGFETDADTTTARLGAQNSFELMSTLFVNVSRGTGTTVIAAASGTQFAYENGDLKNGVFTYCFLETMHTEKTCTVQQMKTKVSTRVTELTNGLQRPTSRTETSGYDWKLW